MPNSQTNLPCYVETVPGIEEIAWLEIRDRLPTANFGDFMYAKNERGVVLFQYDDAVKDLFKLRTIESAFVVGAYLPKTSRGYRDLQEMRDQMVRTGDFGRAVNALTRYRHRQTKNYRLVVKKYGQHEYSRNDFRKAVIQGIDAVYPDWERVPKDEDVEIWANVFGSTILVGLRLRPPRDWRPEGRGPGSLPESVAEAMVLLTEPVANDVFVDPLCDAGAIVGARVASPARFVLGGDTEVERVALAVQNVGQRAALMRWVGSALPLADRSVNKVATRFPPLPYERLAPEYDGWLGELQRVLRPEGLAVVLTTEYDLFKNAIREYRHLQIRSGYSVLVGKEWGRIYLVDRLS